MTALGTLRRVSRHALAAGGLLALALLSGGCLERVDSDLPATARASAGEHLHWRLVDRFGGRAQVSVESSDPWELRYAPGGFKQIAGLCVYRDEVWVCDLGLSRIQVFSFDGQLRRVIGAGVDLARTLAGDEQLFLEGANYKTGMARWEDGGGMRWVGAERELFKVADVVVTPDGYWAADWAQTGSSSAPKRDGGVYFVPADGTALRRVFGGLDWPAYLALGGGALAISQPAGNVVWLQDAQDLAQSKKMLGQAQVSFDQVMRVKLFYHESKNYLNLERYVTHAGGEAGQFNGAGGVALAFDKLVACDAANHRLQVFDARYGGNGRPGSALRVVGAQQADGGVRFYSPRDVDVAADGTVFVLDAERLEVAVLSSKFERLGSFAHGDLTEPWQLDLSDDGHDCFITDRRESVVLHYVAED
jgi:hypothetical protein